MRKQTKIAAVVSAAALLALGASITSFAASRGTWMLVDGEWYCYDSSGDPYENTFCLSNGKEYYVGDDGILVRSQWVEDDGDYYFVNSAGQKITNDWRLTTPYDDEDAEEQWFYFQSTGKRAEDKKLTIKGKTYFFNTDGEMLIGWVQENGDSWDEASSDDIKANSNTYYCGEDGARLESAWVYDYAPSVDPDDVGSEDEQHWYWLKSSGKVATGKQSSVNGQTYFFDNEGKMLSGWVAQTDSDSGYVQIWEDDEDTDGIFSTALSAYKDIDVYFCGDEDDGHMKKDKWIKLWSNVDYGAEDEDNDEYWYYINSSGKVYIPDDNDLASASDAVRYSFDDGEGESFSSRFSDDNYDSVDSFLAVEKKINSKTYYFDENGRMLSSFVMMWDQDEASQDETTGKMYYFGGSDDGQRKDGSISLTDDNGESYRFYFATDDDRLENYYNAAGVSGARNGKLYDHGLIITATDDKYELKTVYIQCSDGTHESGDYSFIVNKSGSIQSSAKEYEEDDDVLIAATNATFCDDRGALRNSVTGAVVH